METWIEGELLFSRASLRENHSGMETNLRDSIGRIEVCCVRTIVVWKLKFELPPLQADYASCVRTIVVWKPGVRLWPQLSQVQCCVRTIVVWKHEADSRSVYLGVLRCVRTIVVWKRFIGRGNLSDYVLVA